jgi:antitoxin component of MazEF toxin-antitoxin module
MDTIIIENVRFTQNGEIIIPKHICDKLNLSLEDEVALVVENGKLTIENPVVSAMRKLQKEMSGKFEEAGLNTDDDIMALVREVRAEVEGL